MSPSGTGALACWHSGGGIESRCGPLTRNRALQLLRFHAAELRAACSRNDTAAAIFCVRAWLDIAAAILAADAWRAAASSCVR